MSKTCQNLSFGTFVHCNTTNSKTVFVYTIEAECLGKTAGNIVKISVKVMKSDY